MATTLSPDTFLTVVRNSGLIQGDQLERLLSEFSADSAEAFAQEFMRRGLLTQWQCDKLLQGRHKGFVLGKYRLLSLLGKGGMSAVYLAEHMLMRRRCAIKVLPSRASTTHPIWDVSIEKHRLLRCVDHPNIVRAYDVDHEQDGDRQIHFLVMEYVEGRSLHEVVQQDGVLDFNVAADFIRQAALGLAYAHGAGLVHRDIKPGNLLLDRTGVVKILDLGLARFSGEEDDHSLTVAHDEKVLGTADYLAPEQALDSHNVDFRADIYSLGCTLYFLLTGSPPFTEGSLAQRLMAHQTKAPPPISAKRPNVPKGLAAIVSKMMAKRTNDRYQNAEEVAAVLENWISDSQQTNGSSGNVTGRSAISAEQGSSKVGGIRQSNSGVPRRSPSSVKGGTTPSGETNKQSPPSLSRPTTVSAGSPTKPSSPPPEVNFSVSSTSNNADSEFASFQILDTAPPLSGSARSSVVRSRKRKKAIPPIIWFAIAAAILLVLIVVAVILVRPGSQRGESSKPPRQGSITDSGKEQQESEGPGPGLIGKEITVGPDGNFKTIKGALEYIQKFTPPGQSETQVVKVAGGVTYPESISIDNQFFTFPAKIRIVSVGDSPAILSPRGSGPVIRLNSVDHSEIDGFELNGEGRAIVVMLDKYLTGTKLRNLKIRSLSGIGIQGVGLAGSSSAEPVILENIEFECTSGSAVALVPGKSSRTSYLLLSGIRVFGPADNGVLISDALDSIEIEKSIFYQNVSGIRVEGEQRVRNLQIKNSTFYENDIAIRIEAPPDGTSDGLAIQRNIFAESKESDIRVERGFDPDRFKNLLATGNPLSQNVTSREEPDPQGPNLFADKGVTGAEFAFSSTNIEDESFLSPGVSSPAAALDGAGAESFSGAVMPE